MTVEIYGKPQCVQCDATVRHAKRKNIDYEYFQFSDHDIAQEIAREAGYMSAPVVIVKDDAGEIVNHWAGYSPDKLNAVR